ncbi:MAG: hypothetical protein KGR26_09310 [Cyanobacteria bacterium REEB65]|nr:hypothetical protein [Cyanobacteria bacterium REEB65]
MTELLTSEEETPPAAVEPAPATLTCHFCADTFSGAARWAQRGLHEKRKHPDERAKAKAAPQRPISKVKRKPPAKPAPKPVGKRRVPAAESISQALAGIGNVIARSDPPTGRALAFSAPATGAAIDELVAGTFVDRLVVQKVVGVADKWERVGGVIAFPVLVAVISRKPALFDPLEGYLRDATTEVLIASVPSLAKKKAREQKAVDALRQLGQVDERYAHTDDPIGLLLRDIFGVQTEDGGTPE